MSSQSAPAAADPAGGTVLSVLLLPVGQDLYALDMTRVREVVAAPLVTKVPTAPHTVLGVFNLRGDIVPLFDTATLLGFGSAPSGSFAAVVETSKGYAGLVATEIPESTDVRDPLGVTETEGTIAAYAIGIRIATLLDVSALFAPPRIGGWTS